MSDKENVMLIEFNTEIGEYSIDRIALYNKEKISE